MDFNNKRLSDVESELFALINSMTNLYQKYQEGTINNNFFRKAVKNAMKGLIKIKIFFNERNISLTEILINMNFEGQYNKAINIFDEIDRKYLLEIAETVVNRICHR